MDFDNWLDVPEPWPDAPRRRRWREKKRSRIQSRYQRIQKVRALQDDRAATYSPYNCSRCERDNSCCKCPDPRPEIPVPTMYIIDVQDRNVRQLTYYETLHILKMNNHDIWMEPYIGRSFWRGLFEDPTIWYCGPPDPLYVNYMKPSWINDDDD